MTDDKIMQALECCITENAENNACRECPYMGSRCQGQLLRDAYILIRRLSRNQEYADKFARDLCKERMLEGKPVSDFETLQEYMRKSSQALQDEIDTLKSQLSLAEETIDNIEDDLDRGSSNTWAIEHIVQYRGRKYAK